MVADIIGSCIDISMASHIGLKYIFRNAIRYWSQKRMIKDSFGLRKTAQFNFHVFHDVNVFHAVFNFNGGLNVFSGVEIT